MISKTSIKVVRQILHDIQIKLANFVHSFKIKEVILDTFFSITHTDRKAMYFLFVLKILNQFFFRASDGKSSYIKCWYLSGWSVCNIPHVQFTCLISVEMKRLPLIYFLLSVTFGVPHFKNKKCLLLKHFLNH